MKFHFRKKHDSDEKAIKEEEKKKFKIELTPSAVVLATYILLLLSKLVNVTLITRENEYYSIVILQLMIFFVPGAVWCKFNGEKYLKGLRLRMPKASSIVLILSGAFLMISGGLLISALLGGLESFSQNFSLYDTFVTNTDNSLPSKMYLVAAYAIIPAICEEFIFRGILCYEYENGGVMRAVVFSSLFFALLHFNPVNILVYLFSGVILALVLYATRSLIGAMIVHFLYNLFGLFGQPYMNMLYSITRSSMFFLFIVAGTFVLSGVPFCHQAAKLYKKYLYDGISSNYRQPVLHTKEKIKASYISVIKEPTTIACFVFYVFASILYMI